MLKDQNGYYLLKCLEPIFELVNSVEPDQMHILVWIYASHKCSNFMGSKNSFKLFTWYGIFSLFPMYIKSAEGDFEDI